mgnify:CR=1 FL=1|jgi:hypothetical protein
MNMSMEEFTNLANETLREKAATLKALSFEEVENLPWAFAEDVLVGKKEVQITVYKQANLPQLGDDLLITVQLARFGLGGVAIYLEEEGIVFSKTKAVRQATGEELAATRG